MTNPVRIIVNADDLGISQQVNQAIFRLIAARQITSATVMANGPAINHALLLAKQFPAGRFGVHLNISEFQPLYASSASLLNSSGVMSRRHIEAASPTPLFLRTTYLEFCSQIESLLNRGLRLTHIDSHHHVHTLPKLFPVLKAVQKRYGIRVVRCTRNIYAHDHPLSLFFRLKKGAFNAALRSIYRTQTTDAFTDLLTLVAITNQTNRFRSIEAMVHPGALNHEVETALLQSDWLSRLPFPATLTDFQDL